MRPRIDSGAWRKAAGAGLLLVLLGTSGGCEKNSVSSVFSFDDSRLVALNLRVDLVVNNAALAKQIGSAGVYPVTASLVLATGTTNIDLSRIGGPAGSQLALAANEIGSDIPVLARIPAGAGVALLSFTLTVPGASSLTNDTPAVLLSSLAVAKPNQPSSANAVVKLSLASTVATKLLSQQLSQLTPSDSLSNAYNALVSSLETIQQSVQGDINSAQAIAPSTCLAAIQAAIEGSIVTQPSLQTQVEQALSAVIPTSNAAFGQDVGVIATDAQGIVAASGSSFGAIFNQGSESATVITVVQAVNNGPPTPPGMPSGGPSVTGTDISTLPNANTPPDGSMDDSGDTSTDSSTSTGTSTSPPTTGTAITQSSNARTDDFTGSVTVTWGAASDSVTPTASLQYKVVMALLADAIDTVDDANTCAAPCSVVTDWTAGLTSATANGLMNNSQYQIAVLVQNDGGEMALYDPVAITTPGFAALVDSSGNYDLLTRNTVANAAQVMQSNNSAWTQLGANFGADVTSDTLSLTQDSNGTLDAAIQNYYCDSWVNQTEVFRYAAGNWSQLGADLAGTVIHCSSYSGTGYPTMVDFGGGTLGVTLQESLGTWQQVLQYYSGGAWQRLSPISIGATQLSSYSLGGGTVLLLGDNGTTPGFYSLTTSGLTSLNLGISLGANQAIGEPVGAPANRIAVDGTEYYAAYIDPTNGGAASVQKYSTVEGSWSQVGDAGFSDGAVMSISAIYANANLYVLFKDLVNAGDATLMKWAGSTWTTLSSGIFGNEVSMPLMRYNSATGNIDVYAVVKGATSMATVVSIADPAVPGIFIADYGDNRLVKLTDMVGTTFQTYGTSGNSTNQFNQLADVAYKNGQFYLADRANQRIVRVDDLSGTNWTALTGSGGDTFSSPYGLSVDPAGRIYVADTGHHRIVRFDDMTGTNWTTYGSEGSGTGQFVFPRKVMIGTDGEIYVADTSNNRLVRMDDMDGTNWTTYGTSGSGTGNFSSPWKLATDSQGRIYVSDSGNNRIVRIDSLTGANWTSYGSAGSGTGEFSSPYSLCLDANNKIYVGDEGNGRIVEIDDMSGANFTPYGTSGSGTGQFSIPYGLSCP